MQERRNISAYRNELKGLAILWVVFFHAQLGLSGIAYDIQKIGYGGVDIFFFLTGFGLYYSLDKSSDLKGYYTRRFKRILPAYLPFCILWLAVMIPCFHLGTAQNIRIVMGNLLMVGFFADVPKMINWYVSALIVAIVLAPSIFALLKGSKNSNHALAGLLVVSLGIGLCFVGNGMYMAVSRLPIFIVGMWFAMPAKKEHKRHTVSIVSFAALVLGIAVLMLCFGRYPELLNDYGMYWHPFAVITPALCILLGKAFHRMEGIKRIFAPLRFLGKASFEIFLFNVWLEVLCKQFEWASDAGSWVLWSAISIVVGCLYHYVVSKIMQVGAAKRIDAK